MISNPVTDDFQSKARVSDSQDPIVFSPFLPSSNPQDWVSDSQVPSNLDTCGPESSYRPETCEPYGSFIVSESESEEEGQPSYSDNLYLELESSSAPFTITFSKIALEYFNSKHHSDFTLVKPTDYGVYFAADPILHLNFTAQSTSFGGHSDLFYAELQTHSLDLVDIDEKDVKVLGCSLLRQADLGNPMGFSCDVCDCDTLIHPGPLHGYCVAKGDRFEEALFWNYRPSKCFFLDEVKKRNAKNVEFFTACAKKAIEHLDCKLVVVVELLKVIDVVNRIGDPMFAIHMNFTVRVKVHAGLFREKLCFAELFLPLRFAGKDWNIEAAQYLEVRGCCIMEEFQYHCADAKNGRLCGMCGETLVHPGPAYGYSRFLGDDFAESDFKRIGRGFFLNDQILLTVEPMDAAA